MAKQGFNYIGGNPFIYHEDDTGPISVALGLNDGEAVWKIRVLATAGATPVGTGHITIDPAVAGNITITPNGVGKVVIGNMGIGAVTSTAAGHLGVTGAGVAGQVLKSNGPGFLPTFQNESNWSWHEVLGVSQALAVQNAYVMNNVGLITATLPAVAAFGDSIIIVGKGVGGWLIAQNAGQTIHIESLDTTTGIVGSVASTNKYDSVELVCITANTDFVIRSSVGNLTIV